jgi:hypothetical protein
MGWFGIKQYHAHTINSEQPTNGSISGNAYTNNFFEFTLQFPVGWKALPSDSSPQVSAKAISYVLLLVGSTDSRMHGSRWITIAASRPPGPGAFSFTAQDVAKRAADALKAEASRDPRASKIFGLAGEPSDISIGGKRLARLDTTGQVNVQGKAFEIAMSQLTIMERGYLVVFLFTDPKGHESDREAARKAMDSLHFFGKTN